MNSKEVPIYSNYSDYNGNHIYIYMKNYGKFVLEDKIDKIKIEVRLSHWKEALQKIQNFEITTEENTFDRKCLKKIAI